MLDPETHNTEVRTSSRNHNNLFVHKDIRNPKITLQFDIQRKFESLTNLG